MGENVGQDWEPTPTSSTAALLNAVKDILIVHHSQAMSDKVWTEQPKNINPLRTTFRDNMVTLASKRRAHFYQAQWVLNDVYCPPLDHRPLFGVHIYLHCECHVKSVGLAVLLQSSWTEPCGKLQTAERISERASVISVSVAVSTLFGHIFNLVLWDNFFDSSEFHHCMLGSNCSMRDTWGQTAPNEKDEHINGEIFRWRITFHQLHIQTSRSAMFKPSRFCFFTYFHQKMDKPFLLLSVLWMRQKWLWKSLHGQNYSIRIPWFTKYRWSVA